MTFPPDFPRDVQQDARTWQRDAKVGCVSGGDGSESAEARQRRSRSAVVAPEVVAAHGSRQLSARRGSRSIIPPAVRIGDAVNPTGSIDRRGSASAMPAYSWAIISSVAIMSSEAQLAPAGASTTSAPTASRWLCCSAPRCGPSPRRRFWPDRALRRTYAESPGAQRAHTIPPRTSTAAHEKRAVLTPIHITTKGRRNVLAAEPIRAAGGDDAETRGADLSGEEFGRVGELHVRCRSEHECEGGEQDDRQRCADWGRQHQADRSVAPRKKVLIRNDRRTGR